MLRKRVTWSAAWLGFSVVLYAGMSHPLLAQDPCRLPAEVVRERPAGESGAPTEVSVGVFVIDLISISDVDQTFTADYLFTLGWSDSRLAESALGRSLAACNTQLSDIWHPQVEIVNRRGTDEESAVLEIGSDGTVLYRRRVLGTLSSPLQLRDYPFDSQSLVLDTGSFRYGPEEVQLRASAERMGRLSGLELGGWDLGEATSEASTEFLPAQGRELSRLVARLEVSRRSTFYLWKVFFPLSLIMLMAWTVFFLEPSALAPQVSVSTASVLTLIAFQLSLGYLLPRLEYLTRIDRFVFGATFLVFLALGQVVVRNRLFSAGRKEAARRFNLSIRWGYPALFIALWLWTAPF